MLHQAIGPDGGAVPLDRAVILDGEFLNLSNTLYHLDHLLAALCARIQDLDHKHHDAIPTLHTTSVLTSLAYKMAHELSERLIAIDLGEEEIAR